MVVVYAGPNQVLIDYVASVEEKKETKKESKKERKKYFEGSCSSPLALDFQSWYI